MFVRSNAKYFTIRGVDALDVDGGAQSWVTCVTGVTVAY